MPLQTARAVQGFMRGFTRANGLLIRWFNDIANAILHRLGIEPQEELASARSAEELTSLVRRSAQQGTLELETATLLQRSLAFGDRREGDCLGGTLAGEVRHSHYGISAFGVQFHDPTRLTQRDLSIVTHHSAAFPTLARPPRERCRAATTTLHSRHGYVLRDARHRPGTATLSLERF